MDAEMLGSLMMFACGQGGEAAELGERVADLLLGREVLREGGEDAAGEGDVAGLDLDARLAGVTAWTIGRNDAVAEGRVPGRGRCR